MTSSWAAVPVCGADPSAAAWRGVLLATSLVTALAGAEGTAAMAQVRQVRQVLRQAWREYSSPAIGG